MKLSELLRAAAAELRRHGDANTAAELNTRAAVLERVAYEVKFNRFADNPTPTGREILKEIGEQP